MSHPDRGLTDFPTLPVLPYLARSGVVWWNLAMWTPPHLFKTLTWQAHSRLAVPFFMNFTMSHPKPVYSSLLHPSMYKNYGPWPRKIPPAVWIFSKPTAPPLDQAAVIPSQGYFSAVFLKLFFFFPVGGSTDLKKHSFSGSHKYRVGSWEGLHPCMLCSKPLGQQVPCPGLYPSPLKLILPVVSGMIFSGTDDGQSVL